MLENDPPVNTQILIVRGVNVPTGTVGRLVRRGGYEIDRPDDLFEVEIEMDQRQLVIPLRRCDIRRA